MNNKKGILEERITNAIVKVQKEQTGRGATEGKADIVRDMIVVRLKGVLTPAERNLLNDVEGPKLVKELRYHLEQMTRPIMEKLIYETTGVKVSSIYGDVSTKTGERIEVFILEENLENKLLEKE